jgi:hypothetical protein
MISTHIHHVSKVEASEAVKLASGSYSRVYTMHTERGETYEIIVYATTAWLELKSRVKITRGDNYLLIAFWVGVVHHGGISSRHRVWGLLPEEILH